VSAHGEPPWRSFDHDEVDVLPVRARFHGDTCRFGVLPGGATDFENREVSLVIDDGMYWFELRGVSVRGMAAPHAAPAETAAAGLTWYAIEPRRVLAWDYGTIRAL
jgi:hypothetical protein